MAVRRLLRRAARAPLRRAVPMQDGSEVPIVRGATLVEAPVNVLHLPAEAAQARLAGSPVGRDEDAGQGRGGNGPSVLAQDEAPVAGQAVNTGWRVRLADRHQPFDSARRRTSSAPVTTRR